MKTRVIGASTLLIGALAAGACGDDEPEPNLLRITERDYAFDVGGDARGGTLTIQVENGGAELHEVAMLRLRPGSTVDDVRSALTQPGAFESEENPLAALVEEDAPIDDLGGAHFPGAKYEITGSGIEAGNYVVVCFVPNADGEPHAALGMLAGFTVGEGEADDVPSADFTYTVTDEAIDGPEQVEAGQTTIEVVNDSSTAREITLAKLAEGKSLDDVAAFFESADDGAPDVSASPFEFFTFVFDAEQDRTLTVDLTVGQWFLGAGDPENPFEGPPAEDPFTTAIAVS